MPSAGIEPVPVFLKVPGTYISAYSMAMRAAYVMRASYVMRATNAMRVAKGCYLLLYCIAV